MLYSIKIILVLILSINANAEGLIDNFLNQVKSNAIDYKIVELETGSKKLNNELVLSQFDITGLVRGEYSDSEDVATSPFSPDSTKSYKYSLGINKKWRQGFETGLSYSLTDNLIQFPSGQDVEYLSPDLNVSFKTSIFQDLIYGKSRSIESKVVQQSKTESLNEQIRKKSILIKSLLILSELLEQKEEVKLQKNLCGQIQGQVRKLRQKSKLGSVPKRDYLLSLKNMNNCKSAERNLQLKLSEKRKILANDYGVDVSQVESIQVNPFFNEVINYYKSSSKSGNIFGARQDLLLIKNKLQTAKLEENEIKAGTKIPLNFEMKLGLKGLRDEFKEAHDDIIDATNPYIMGSLELKFPFANRENKSKLQINKWNQEILKKKIEKENQFAKYRFTLLKENISASLENHERSIANVNLSNSVLREARRDFNNGRIDFFTLSEFQKGLIQSQTQLGSVRIKTIIDVLEYLDYFQFFNRYYTK